MTTRRVRGCRPANRRPGADANRRRLAASVEAVAASVRRGGVACLLCGARAVGVAAFAPTSEGYRTILGVPAGKQRFLFYAACAACARRAARDPEAIEQAAVSAFASGAACACSVQ